MKKYKLVERYVATHGRIYPPQEIVVDGDGVGGISCEEARFTLTLNPQRMIDAGYKGIVEVKEEDTINKRRRDAGLRRLQKDLDRCHIEPRLMRKCESDGMGYMSNPIKYKCKHCGEYWVSGESTPNCTVEPKQKEIERVDLSKQVSEILDPLVELLEGLAGVLEDVDKLNNKEDA